MILTASIYFQGFPVEFAFAFPRLLQICGATMLNLSLLTSDMWAVLIRIFAYHEKVCTLHYSTHSVFLAKKLAQIQANEDQACLSSSFPSNTQNFQKNYTHGACLHMVRSTGSTSLLLHARQLASSYTHTSMVPLYCHFSYGRILASYIHGSP
jgi:hypothetical protein